MTPARRALLRQFANALAWLISTLGIILVIFSLGYWWIEDYPLLDSFHWGMQTLTTVGYGDRPPQTDGGMVLAIAMQPLCVLATLLIGANFVKHAIEDPDAFTHEEQVELRDLARNTNRIVRDLAIQVHGLEGKVQDLGKRASGMDTMLDRLPDRMANMLADAVRGALRETQRMVDGQGETDVEMVTLKSSRMSRRERVRMARVLLQGRDVIMVNRGTPDQP